MRLGLAELNRQNYAKALDAYNNALNRTQQTDRNWSQLMENIQLCKQKLEMSEENSQSQSNSGQVYNKA